MHDHKRAAQTFLEAAKVPGAPYWLESLAASVLGRGGYRSVSREIWKRQYENAGEGAIKENALFNLQLLDALDTVDTLNARAKRYAETSGRPPSSPRDLVAAGLVAGVPRDPTGVPFHFDPATGHFSIARQSKLWRSTYEE
jgi:hypothetical protein